jgi:hypothetical protein
MSSRRRLHQYSLRWLFLVVAILGLTLWYCVNFESEHTVLDFIGTWTLDTRNIGNVSVPKDWKVAVSREQPPLDYRGDIDEFKIDFTLWRISGGRRTDYCACCISDGMPTGVYRIVQFQPNRKETAE